MKNEKKKEENGVIYAKDGRKLYPVLNGKGKVEYYIASEDVAELNARGEILFDIDNSEKY